MHDSLHYRMMVTNNRIHKEILDHIFEEGLCPGQPKILEYLMEKDGCSQVELVKNCGLDKSTIAGILKRMEEKGLIERKKKETDKRSVQVYLTSAGKAAADYVERVFEVVDQKAWGNISIEEQESFLTTLYKIYHNMKAGNHTNEK